MKVNKLCATYVKKFIFRRNAFLNVSDEFQDEEMLLEGTYNMFCKHIKSLEIVLDEHNNLLVNGKANKKDIIIEIIVWIQQIGMCYGMYNEILINEMMRNLYCKRNLDVLNMHYQRLILLLGYIICYL